MALNRATKLSLSCSVSVDTLRQRLQTLKTRYLKTARRKIAIEPAPQEGILLDTHVFHLTSWQPKAPIASKVPAETEDVPPPGDNPRPASNGNDDHIAPLHWLVLIAGESMMGRRQRPCVVLQEENNSRNTIEYKNMVKNLRREKTILETKLKNQRCLLEDINQAHQQMVRLWPHTPHRANVV